MSEALKTTFFWTPCEGHERGLDVVVENNELSDAIVRHGRPWGVRVDGETDVKACHTDEMFELDMHNFGSEATARVLLEVFETGVAGHYGSPTITEAAHKIAELNTKLAEANKEIARLRSVYDISAVTRRDA